MTAIIGLAMLSCSEKAKNNGNPLLEDYSTPFQAPPFNQIQREHFIPAIDSAIQMARNEVDIIISSNDEPSFSNTIEALAFSGTRLGEISNILFNLNYAETDSTLQKIVREIAPKLTDFKNDINLNEDLFKKVKSVYETADRDALSAEQITLLEKTYKGFVRNGANLSEADKETYRQISRELSELSLQFEENVLAETNAYSLHLQSKDDLVGLPQSLIDAAAMTAKEKGLEGWVISLHTPMYAPFMKYSERRDLREMIYKEYNRRAFKGNSNDNQTTLTRIVNLRLSLANLLGYNTYADYVLENRMAESAIKVELFLNDLLKASLPFATKELNEVQQFANSLGVNHTIEKWDWAYYTEKLKNKLYNFNEEELKPYFQLEKVQEGIFLLSNKLYGISFKPNSSVPVYHHDVKVYEVIDNNGEFLALLYLDFFPREGKSGGAWMTSYRNQYKLNGMDTRPLISIVTNFTKPTENAPSLLTFGEFTTFLHEFGHALHGIFANTHYPNLSGTSVYRDFVELPSQVMENWAIEKEFLDLFATHYQTGESIPQEYVKAIIDSKNFLAGNLSIRQLSFGLVDMAWHSIENEFTLDILKFEKEYMRKADVLPSVEGTAFSPAFSHIFGGGYAAGYYSYKWAEVLDADAYSLFKEKGIFSNEVANSFRENILSKGGSEHPMTLYKRFRGHEPSIDALLVRSGLK